MPRDYKSLASARSRKKRSSPGWVWFLSGVLVGLFCAGLVWLKVDTPGPDADTSSASLQPAGKHGGRRGGPAENDDPPPPRFDFYTLLPEMEVMIPEEELQQPRSHEPTVGAPPQQPGSLAPEAYLLQMGSFRKHSDADRMKARLALLDIPAEIQKVTINNKDTYHRVRSGPYQDRARVNELRGRLRQNNINSMVIRLKQ